MTKTENESEAALKESRFGIAACRARVRRERAAKRVASKSGTHVEAARIVIASDQNNPSRDELRANMQGERRGIQKR